MAYIRPLLSLAGLAVLMTGCAYFETQERPWRDWESSYAAGSQPAARVSGSELTGLVNRASGSGIEIFSLDDSTAAAAEATARPQAAVNPSANVQIFPLDDSMRAALSNIGSNVVLASPQMASETAAQGQTLIARPDTDGQEGYVLQPVADKEWQSYAGSKSLTVRFGHDSAALSAGERAGIAALAETLIAGGKTAYVHGHASPEASQKDVKLRQTVNLKVSLDRAMAVAGMLIQAGVPAERVVPKGFGELQLVMESGAVSNAASRRVEIFVQ